MTAAELRRRPATIDDHDRIIEVVDAWWGRPMTAKLPRLFLEHFGDTSRVVESPDGQHLYAFLIGFLSPTRPAEGYIHFVGVDPQCRGRGLAAGLYEEFSDICTRDGRTIVRAITSPVNSRSIAFHRAMGFTVSLPRAGTDDPVRFEKVLD